jgi:hypothetical protein
MMTASNLGICVGQSLVWSVSDSVLNPATAAVKVPRVVGFLVEHFVELFGNQSLLLFDDGSADSQPPSAATAAEISNYSAALLDSGKVLLFINMKFTKAAFKSLMVIEKNSKHLVFIFCISGRESDKFDALGTSLDSYLGTHTVRERLRESRDSGICDVDSASVITLEQLHKTLTHSASEMPCRSREHFASSSSPFSPPPHGAATVTWSLDSGSSLSTASNIRHSANYYPSSNALLNAPTSCDQSVNLSGQQSDNDNAALQCSPVAVEREKSVFENLSSVSRERPVSFSVASEEVGEYLLSPDERKRLFFADLPRPNTFDCLSIAAAGSELIELTSMAPIDSKCDDSLAKIKYAESALSHKDSESATQIASASIVKALEKNIDIMQINNAATNQPISDKAHEAVHVLTKETFGDANQFGDKMTNTCAAAAADVCEATVLSPSASRRKPTASIEPSSSPSVTVRIRAGDVANVSVAVDNNSVVHNSNESPAKTSSTPASSNNVLQLSNLGEQKVAQLLDDVDRARVKRHKLIGILDEVVEKNSALHTGMNRRGADMFPAKLLPDSPHGEIEVVGSSSGAVTCADCNKRCAPTSTCSRSLSSSLDVVDSVSCPCLCGKIAPDSSDGTSTLKRAVSEIHIHQTADGEWLEYSPVTACSSNSTSDVVTRVIDGSMSAAELASRKPMQLGHSAASDGITVSCEVQVSSDQPTKIAIGISAGSTGDCKAARKTSAAAKHSSEANSSPAYKVSIRAKQHRTAVADDTVQNISSIMPVSSTVAELPSKDSCSVVLSDQMSVSSIEESRKSSATRESFGVCSSDRKQSRVPTADKTEQGSTFTCDNDGHTSLLNSVETVPSLPGQTVVSDNDDNKDGISNDKRCSLLPDAPVSMRSRDWHKSLVEEYSNPLPSRPHSQPHATTKKQQQQSSAYSSSAKTKITTNIVVVNKPHLHQYQYTKRASDSAIATSNAPQSRTVATNNNNNSSSAVKSNALTNVRSYPSQISSSAELSPRKKSLVRQDACSAELASLAAPVSDNNRSKEAGTVNASKGRSHRHSEDVSNTVAKLKSAYVGSQRT